LNRAELQQLATERIEDARALLAASQWPGAYYLAGYSVECALKSCVLAYIERTGIIFEDKKYAEKCWTHDLEDLVRQAGLTVERDRATGSNLNLCQNWLIAKDWSESSRYRRSTQLQAEKLFTAITDHTDGVLPWLKTFW
jgi:HEPN domain-containing protein